MSRTVRVERSLGAMVKIAPEFEDDVPMSVPYVERTLRRSIEETALAVQADVRWDTLRIERQEPLPIEYEYEVDGSGLRGLLERLGLLRRRVETYVDKSVQYRASVLVWVEEAR